ncbi:MAG: hypothetical protein EOM20_07805 [Spartobacteria bacterium]|nr:hypothetical protein [Spartobacteria bacterium]
MKTDQERKAVTKEQVLRSIDEAETLVDQSLATGEVWGAKYAKTYLTEMKGLLNEEGDPLPPGRIKHVSAGINRTVFDDGQWYKSQAGALFADAVRRWRAYMTQQPAALAGAHS